MRSKRVLQNASYAGCHIGNPTIRIEEGQPEWEQAYSNWLNGKSPTDSTDWQLGAFLHFEKVEEPPSHKKSFLYSIPGMKLVRWVGNIILIVSTCFLVWMLTILYWLLFI